jgi:hypothetical protein
MVFGILKDMANLTGEIVGTVVGVPLGVIAKSLEVPEELVKKAIDSGCKTMDEIEEWLDER